MSKQDFASAGFKMGQMNAIYKLLIQQGGEDGPDMFLRGEIMVSKPPCSYHELDGVVYFTLISNGTTGKEWIKRLEGKGYYVCDFAKSLLRSPNFIPTDKVRYEIAVLKSMLFADKDRTTKNIRAEADKRNLIQPNAEIACLIREKFTDEEIEAMGLWGIVAMHEPIEDSVGYPDLLGADRDGYGRRLGAYYVKPGG